jgi:hypothetical protein
MNGKGDTPRPLSVNRDTFESNWERIFSRKRYVDELTEISQEIGLYDAPERSEVNAGQHPGIDEDGNRIEQEPC